MSDFLNFMLANAEKNAAFQQCNYAAVNFENAQIKARLAEIKSQQEPLAGLIDARLSERERLYAAAFYVVVGRLPPESAP